MYKISPDISDSQIKILSEIFLEKKINGLILTNTSVQNKKDLKDKNKYQEGGISGRTIYNLSNQVIKKFYTQLIHHVQSISLLNLIFLYLSQNFYHKLQVRNA